MVGFWFLLICFIFVYDFPSKLGFGRGLNSQSEPDMVIAINSGLGVYEQSNRSSKLDK